MLILKFGLILVLVEFTKQYEYNFQIGEIVLLQKVSYAELIPYLRLPKK